MKPVWKKTYKVMRILLLTAVALTFTVPAALYVVLSLPSVHDRLRLTAERELSGLLTVPVEISRVSFSPFNRATLMDVTVRDLRGDTCLHIDRLGAGVNLRQLLQRRIVFDYGEIIGLDARITRDSIGAPMNIQPIVTALSRRDTTQAPKPFDFAVKTIVLRKSRVSYDVLDRPSTPGHFNASHIAVCDLRADLRLPRIANDDFSIDIRRLAMSEHSGLTVKNLTALIHITKSHIFISRPSLQLLDSQLKINDQSLPRVRLSTRQGRESYPFNLEILKGSRLAVADLAPFIEPFGRLDIAADIEARIKGPVTDIAIERLSVSQPGRLRLSAAGHVSGLTRGTEAMEADFPEIIMEADGSDIADIAACFTTVRPRLDKILRNTGSNRLEADFNGSITDGHLKATLQSAPGNIGIDGSYLRSDRTTRLTGTAKTDGFDCSRLLVGTGHEFEQFGRSALRIDADISVGATHPQGTVSLEAPLITYRGHSYTDITADLDINGTLYKGNIDIDNPGALLKLSAEAQLEGNDKSLDFDIRADEIDLSALNLMKNDHGRRLRLQGSGSLRGPDLDHINGYADLHGIDWTDKDGKGLRLESVVLEALSTGDHKDITLRSDVADGSLSGDFRWKSLPAVAKGIVERVLPNLTGAGTSVKQPDDPTPDRLHMTLKVKDTAPIESVVKLPVKVIHPVDITADINGENRTISLAVDAPYLLQGNKILENTALRMGFDGSGDASLGRANLYATTLAPTKDGPMTVQLTSFGDDGRLDTQLSWHINRPQRYTGEVNFTTRFERDEDRRLTTAIDFSPSGITINDTTWTVAPSAVTIADKRVSIDRFSVSHGSQHIAIDGVASTEPSDSLKLSLQGIDLDYVFETLAIDAAMFGGRATGEFYVTSAFTPQPVAYTPHLQVEHFTYNGTLLGEADIRSAWDPVAKAITLDAEVSHAEGRKSYVRGDIKPMCYSLDLSFDADRLPVGFLQHFMSAFATKVSGYASGKARLYGTFKLVDMTGDVYGEDVSITLGFTNTTYTTTDSVRLREGLVALDNLTIRDKYGHSAKLNGRLTHHHFKEPSYDFTVTDARDLLVYDVPERDSERWFGTVFGSGTASVDGHPGVVNIGVDVSTSPNSTFTFVLTDDLQASEYNFITFRNRDTTAVSDDRGLVPDRVLRLKQHAQANNVDDHGSVYVMNLKVDVNPNALVTLVMDPVGGDRIVSRGNGNMRLSYNSANEDVHMFGKYTLTRGNYNFTLQDIIIKDFTIADGSSITFNGNPYAAQLDIKASYNVNANLSDLDESFLQDKELNRTNVPVHAMLLVNGDMRQPEIHYDLEFPTLTQDVYRKVRSIVNTDEMMNRQIIYLLLLNRFYTPDYVSATKGNELVSVASSTISSQLSNMLGQLSDNWSISPNFRSDRGDFSDVEVDVALSSQLLNNRLLLNGNFGYRDKALNNNSFIGDFDIEYLLNRMGTIRLKAYNRYNDQNYYAKSALTTQGVGVVFKRDFDSLTSWTRPWLRWLRGKRANKTDTVAKPAIPADTLIMFRPKEGHTSSTENNPTPQ